jgi:glycosyltransferase involved in cell wall biosynthesis
MKIIFFSHPPFFNSVSMRIYIKMLVEGFQKKGHEIEIWTPKALFFKLPVPASLKKWMGYIDQFIIFPLIVKKKLFKSKNTMFVFADNALGPWVPLVANKPHVIHCHDFMAQRTAIGQISENKINFTGKLYQKLIRNGFKKGANFISVSLKTQTDLHAILNRIPHFSEVAYNGLNPIFKPLDLFDCRKALSAKLKIDFETGYLLHIGGNMWYKNRIGVVKLYEHWRKIGKTKLPLLLLGEPASNDLLNTINNSVCKSDIFLFSGLSDREIHLAYCGASLFLFPSLDEGFGWPIAEALACGCLVLTTGENPMMEVGGDAAFYIKKKPNEITQEQKWLNESADKIESILQLNDLEKKLSIDAGFKQIEKFDLTKMIDKIERMYNDILLESTI